MSVTVWVVRSSNSLYGPFKTAGEAGEWLEEYVESLLRPHMIEHVDLPWDMPEKVDAARRE